MEGGNSVRLSDAEAEYPIISPDGKTIAYSHEDPSANPRKESQSWRSKVDHRRIISTFFVDRDVVSVGADSRSLLYTKNEGGVDNIGASRSGGKPKQMTISKRTDFKFRLVTRRQTAGYESWHNKTRRAADPRSQVTPSGA
jgi:hypothetical protein